MKKKWTNNKIVKNRIKLWAGVVVGCIVICFLCLFAFHNVSYASWIEEEDGIKYIQDDGQFAIGFLEIDENRYYFDLDGHLVYGKFYVEEEDCYYYSNEEGIVQYGAIQTEDDFYITDATGKLLTGFAEYDGNRYYFNQIAQLVVGWFKHDNNWYYSDSTGKVMTGFVTVDGYRYYLHPDGTRVKEAVLEIDGITYLFNSDGSVDENATILYPVFQYLNKVRAQNRVTELILNDKVQACAILRASELVNGFSVDSAVSVEQLLANRGVKCIGGYEFAFGGVEGYDIERLMIDMQKDVNLMQVLNDKNVTEVGLGLYQQGDIYYYNLIFIAQEH